MLLPGLNGTEGLFTPLLNSAPDKYSVVCVPYPTHRKCSYQELQHLVEDRLMTIDTSVILVGESFAGPLALKLHQANGVVGIVLVATFVSPPTLRIGRWLPWRGLFSVAAFSGRIISRYWPTGFLSTLSAELHRVSADVMADRMHSVFAVDATAELSQCSVPVVYFRATKDLLVPFWNVRRIVKINPQVAVADFVTTHFLLQSKPQQAWREIESFIEGLR